MEPATSLRAQGFGVRARRFQSDDSGLLLATLLQGAGIGPVGRNELDRRLEQGELVEVLGDWSFEPTPVYIVRPRANRRADLMTLFVDRVVDALETWF